MPDTEFCGDLEPHQPHGHTRLFKVLQCPGRQMPDAGKDAEEWEVRQLNAGPYVIARKGSETYPGLEFIATYLSALQQQLADVRQALWDEISCSGCSFDNAPVNSHGYHTGVGIGYPYKCAKRHHPIFATLTPGAKGETDGE